MCHHCRTEMSTGNQHYHYHQRSSPKSYQQYHHHYQQQQHQQQLRSRTPPHYQYSHQLANRPVVGYSPPAKQLAGGRMHEPPRPEDLPVPPMDWCGALEADQRQQQQEQQEQQQQLMQAQVLQMQCDLASQMLKRMLNVSA